MDILLHIIGYWLIGLIICAVIDIVGKSPFRSIEFLLALFWPLIVLFIFLIMTIETWLSFCDLFAKAWKELF